MRFLYLEPANDWTGQTVEERLRLCAETLYAHQLLNARRFNQVTSGITLRADRQRDLRARNRTNGAPRHAGEAEGRQANAATRSAD
ncbi:MAG TPA: hypothetical protein VMQ93_17780 [Novosphingobium sp.]|nr:hypothetical protein [Novosphingobium sp.]